MQIKKCIYRQTDRQTDRQRAVLTTSEMVRRTNTDMTNRSIETVMGTSTIVTSTCVIA